MTDAKFWNRVAPRYAARPIADEPAYATTLERTASYLAADASVLEAGAGTGTTARRLSPHVGRVLATDIASALLDVARSRIEADGITNITLEERGVGDLPEGPFDAAIAFNLLHLVPDPAAALAAMAARVRPGGYVITKTTALAGAWYFRPIIGVMRLFGKAPRVRFFSVAELDALHEAAGLTIVETGNYPAKPPARFIVAQKA
ncbi:class I SAM-dependent methyltransferase [Oceanicola sp. 502str15]|uniref:class I SAM-dependent methyltransferase n=1 Tax=Oceanicola sp. 502str15 TaxID=2696061 RepID=UPI0020957853|nr:class I SAM-dependent methyltransferase [Oceanicola sp. 502str15]MCO6383629.1 methyltransferase domain-containing protein [Oceanicola sp. 502str15]